MDKTEVNMNVLNKVIAFKLLRILRDNGFIEDGKYANIERKSIQYGESIISQNKVLATVRAFGEYLRSSLRQERLHKPDFLVVSLRLVLLSFSP